MLGYQEDDVAAKELAATSSAEEVKANNCGRPTNNVAVHPAHAAREIFDYMNNHYFDYYGGSA